MLVKIFSSWWEKREGTNPPVTMIDPSPAPMAQWEAREEGMLGPTFHSSFEGSYTSTLAVYPDNGPRLPPIT